MIFVGMDVHDKSTTFCVLNPQLPEKEPCRWTTLPTCTASFRKVLQPLGGQRKAAYEVGTAAQWVAAQVRPLVQEVQVANPSQIPWLYRAGRKNDRPDAKKLATLLYLGQLPRVHWPSAEVCRHGHTASEGRAWSPGCWWRRCIRSSAGVRPAGVFFDRVYRNRKNRYKKALSALGRKLLLLVMCAMLRPGRPFEADRIVGSAA